MRAESRAVRGLSAPAINFIEQAENERGFAEIFEAKVVPRLQDIDAVSERAKRRIEKWRKAAAGILGVAVIAVVLHLTIGGGSVEGDIGDIFWFVWFSIFCSFLFLAFYGYSNQNRDLPRLRFRHLLSWPKYKAAVNGTEILMESVSEFYGEMAYRHQGLNAFDIFRFEKTGIFFVRPRIAYSPHEVEWGSGELTAKCSDRLEGRHRGISFSAVNAVIIESYGEDYASREAFDGWLLEIDAPAPFLETYLAFNSGTEIDVVRGDDVSQTLGDPRALFHNLVPLFGGADIEVALFEGKFLLAVELEHKPFASAERLVEDVSTIEAVARDFLSDAGRPLQIIDKLGWQYDAADLPVWEPSWAKAEHLQAEKARQRETELGAEIRSIDDGTYAVGSRTFKSRADAQAFVDLRTRTQHWAE